MLSTKQKLTQLEGLVGTRSLNSWETGFVTKMSGKTGPLKNTTVLSSNEVDKIDQIYEERCK